MPASPDNNELFTDLTEALYSACSVPCAAVVVEDEDSPDHILGDPEVAKLLVTLESVQATLADGIPRTEAPPFNSALAEAANELMVLRQAPFLAAAFAEIECGVTIADPNLADTPLIYANAAYERMTGYPRAEILGRNCRFLQGELRDQPGVRVMGNALARGTDCTAVVTNFRKNGESFENRVKLRAIRTSDGSISHIIGIQLDVTKERSALDSLALQKRRYESWIEAQSGHIWHMDAAGEQLNVPEEWLELAGLSSSSCLPDLAAIRSALAPEAALAFQNGSAQALKHSTPFEVAYQLPAEGRSPRWFLDRTTPVFDEENRLIEWIVVSQEITELKRAEKAIERAA